jgi:hypothetical protein
MKLSIDHETHYEYSAPLHYALQSIRLTPQASAHQTVLEWAVNAPGTLFAERDGYGNEAHSWSLARRIWRGAIRAMGRVETHNSPWLVDQPGSLAPRMFTCAPPSSRQFTRRCVISAATCCATASTNAA